MRFLFLFAGGDGMGIIDWLIVFIRNYLFISIFDKLSFESFRMLNIVEMV